MLSSGISKQTNSDMQFLSIDIKSEFNFLHRPWFDESVVQTESWSGRWPVRYTLRAIPLWGKASLNQLIDKALNLVIELSIDYSIKQSISQSVLQSISHLIKPFIRWIRFNQFSQSVGPSVSQSAGQLTGYTAGQSVSQSSVHRSIS